MAELSGSIQLQKKEGEPRSLSPAAFAAPMAESAPNSLNEPVLETLTRDLKRIGTKLWHVIVPLAKSKDAMVLREWDLWGPLLFTLILAVTLTLSSMGSDSHEDSASFVFSVVFVLVIVGAVMITMNALLLGGKVSFFQSVSIMGYCVFPMDVIALIVSLGSVPGPFKEILVCIGMAWSTYASLGFLGQLVPEDRRALAVYPVLLFYLFLSWFIIALA